MQQKIIIAIDGYSSCGKSTLAKQLAKELHYIYADSGAMYQGNHFIFFAQFNSAIKSKTNKGSFKKYSSFVFI